MGTTATVLAIAALVALAAAVAGLVQLHRVAPDVAPMHDPVSDYGAGPHAAWYRAQVILVGLASVAIWFGLRSADLDGDDSTWLLVFAISRLAIAGFATDLPGAERTSTGIIHNLLAATAFGSIAIAASRLGGGLADSPSWVFAGSWFGWLGALGAITAVAPAAAATSTPSGNGKKASLATAAPASDNPALWALAAAMREL
ncbi:MAG: DUF998 domain-containing protein, partial [Candidatus Microthrix parvicella]|nr:DUF998 domain-containing protein [Candidatus Microthrix parvicella]